MHVPGGSGMPSRPRSAAVMRSGSPDSLDLMVAFNYALQATDLVLGGASGRLVALRGGVILLVIVGLLVALRRVRL